MGYSPWGCKELDTTEQLTLSLLSSTEVSKDIVMCIPEAEPGLCPKTVLLFLGCSFLVFTSLPPLINNCFGLLFGTQGRP